MKRTIATATMLACACAVTGCGGGATRLVKPVEAYGKALGAAGGVVGDGAATYRRATRMTLLEQIQIGTERPHNQVELTSLIAAANTPRPSASALASVGVGFFCNPIKASYPSAQAAAELEAVGKTMTDTAAASPTTLVGLLAAFGKGYKIEWPKQDASQNALIDAIAAQCMTVTGEVFADAADPVQNPSVDPDLTELNAINGKAWTEGSPSGAAPAAGVGAVFAVIGLIRDVVVKALTIADQQAREKAIADFLAHPDTQTNLKAAVRSLDQAARVAQLAARVDAKDGFRAAWAEFVAARQVAAGSDFARLGDSTELLDAARKVASAAAEVDVTIRSRASDVAAKRTFAEVNQCRTSTPDQPCPRTGLGKALYAGIDRLKASATVNWKDMTDEDKKLYLEGAFGVLSAMVSVSNDLAGFENDKENFRKLSNVIDDLPW